MRKTFVLFCSGSHINTNGGPAAVHGQNTNSNSFKFYPLRADKRITNEYIMVLKDNAIEILHGRMKGGPQKKKLSPEWQPVRK
jgi:hypothetical protein